MTSYKTWCGRKYRYGYELVSAAYPWWKNASDNWFHFQKIQKVIRFSRLHSCASSLVLLPVLPQFLAINESHHDLIEDRHTTVIDFQHSWSPFHKWTKRWSVLSESDQLLFRSIVLYHLMNWGRRWDLWLSNSPDWLTSRYFAHRFHR